MMWQWQYKTRINTLTVVTVSITIKPSTSLKRQPCIYPVSLFLLIHNAAHDLTLAVSLLTQSFLPQLALAVTVALYDDNGCSSLGGACTDLPMWECCEGFFVYGSADMHDGLCFTFTPSAYQNSNPCAVTLGNVDNNVCFDSEFYQITSGYWWWDILGCGLKERDVGVDVDERAAISTANGTMVKKCRKVDTHVWKDGCVLYGIKMDSDEGRVFSGLERGSEEQKAYILANSHSSHLL